MWSRKQSAGLLIESAELNNGVKRPAERPSSRQEAKRIKSDVKSTVPVLASKPKNISTAYRAAREKGKERNAVARRALSSKGNTRDQANSCRPGLSGKENIGFIHSTIPSARIDTFSKESAVTMKLVSKSILAPVNVINKGPRASTNFLPTGHFVPVDAMRKTHGPSTREMIKAEIRPTDAMEISPIKAPVSLFAAPQTTSSSSTHPVQLLEQKALLNMIDVWSASPPAGQLERMKLSSPLQDIKNKTSTDITPVRHRTTHPAAPVAQTRLKSPTPDQPPISQQQKRESLRRRISEPPVIDSNDPFVFNEYAEEHAKADREAEVRMCNIDVASPRPFTCQQRAKAINTLVALHSGLKCTPDVLFTAIRTFDLFIAKWKYVRFYGNYEMTWDDRGLLLAVVAALSLAAKGDSQNRGWTYRKLMGTMAPTWTPNEFMMMETKILEVVGAYTYPTPLQFLRQIDGKTRFERKYHETAKYLVEVAQYDQKFVRVKPSQLAAVANYTARKVMNDDPWNQHLVATSGYMEEVLKELSRPLMMLVLDQNPKTSNVVKKYSTGEFSFVAPVFASHLEFCL
ncbi:hypothetical protein SpCBS45565_g06600 [Spizellomyces sp. 'palustris']|nr:hypothetical protein SpCBS45565_g08123 [Spizellomyces sp. 'palustris']TPX63463.1 hypothetical protein SpCBS45565_g06600 [Spizellomyces sp. 'palustris']